MHSQEPRNLYYWPNFTIEEESWWVLSEEHEAGWYEL
jgi:hypothetical protein